MLEMSWITAILQLYSQVTDIFGNVIVKRVYKTFWFIGTISLHIESPSYMVLDKKSNFSFEFSEYSHGSQRTKSKMSCVMRKPDFCICENKNADQLRGDREADQRLCFRYIYSTFPLFTKSEISSLQPFSAAVQPGLCRIRSETRMLLFS